MFWPFKKKKEEKITREIFKSVLEVYYKTGIEVRLSRVEESPNTDPIISYKKLLLVGIYFLLI